MDCNMLTQHPIRNYLERHPGKQVYCRLGRELAWDLPSFPETVGGKYFILISKCRYAVNLTIVQQDWRKDLFS